MAKGGESYCEGRGFESQQCILDGHFSRLFVGKMFICKDEDKRKRGLEWLI